MGAGFAALAMATPLVLSSSVAIALQVPDRPTGYVNDYAGLLSEGTRQGLEAKLAEFEKETSNQVVVAIFPGLEGEVLEDFSIRLAEKWKVGQKGRDNGVILLVFKNNRKLRIEVGYGLEGALPDALASQIIHREIVPAFKQADFDKGVEAGVNAIISATRGEHKALPGSGTRSQEKASIAFVLMVLYFLAPVVCYFGLLVFGFGFFGIPGLAGALFLIALLILLRSVIFGQTLSGGRGWWGPVSGSSSGGSGWGGGGFSAGGGGFGGGGASGSW